jgi:hypothetical protein
MLVIAIILSVLIAKRCYYLLYKRPQYPTAGARALFKNTVDKCVSTKGDNGENGGSCCKARDDCLFFCC